MYIKNTCLNYNTIIITEAIDYRSRVRISSVAYHNNYISYLLLQKKTTSGWNGKGMFFGLFIDALFLKVLFIFDHMNFL